MKSRFVLGWRRKGEYAGFRMNLEEKLCQLRNAANRTDRDRSLEQQLESLRRLELRRTTPSSSSTNITSGSNWDGASHSPYRVEDCIEGQIEQDELGQFFFARQSLPFGRPYGKFRIGDISLANLSPLNLFLGHATLPDPARLVFLDTETTGLAVDGSAYAFLIGIGLIEGTRFVVRQYFLRDNTDEKAALSSLAKALESYEGVITFNGRIFDIPLLRLVTPLVVSVHPSAGLSIWTFFIPRGNSGSCAWKSAVLQTWKDTYLASPEMAMFPDQKFLESTSTIFVRGIHAAFNTSFFIMRLTSSRWLRLPLSCPKS